MTQSQLLVTDQTQWFENHLRLALHFPQVSAGSGIFTTVVLINPASPSRESWASSVTTAAFAIRTSQAATGTEFSYSIAADGAFILETDGSSSSARSGSLRVVSEGGPARVGMAVFHYGQGGILLTETGIPAAKTTTRARIYVDRFKGHDTGVAIASPADQELVIGATPYDSDAAATIFP